jgi:hypothetical protein
MRDNTIPIDSYPLLFNYESVLDILTFDGDDALVMSSASTRPASLDFCPVSMASRA